MFRGNFSLELNVLSVIMKCSLESFLLFYNKNKGMDNIEKGRQKQMTSYEFCKWKEAFHVPDGEEVLNTRRQEEVCKRGRLESNCSGSFVVSDITEKGLVDKSDNCSCQITEVLSPNPLRMSDGHLQGEKWH